VAIDHVPAPAVADALEDALAEALGVDRLNAGGVLRSPEKKYA
jgi:hypothetical protein